MTIRERFQIIGQAFRGQVPIKEIVKSEKAYTSGFFVDYFKPDGLSSETRISSKVLEANKGWVYRNNDVIAKEVSGIEFELFTVRVVGQEIVLNPVTTHPLLDALDRFNEFSSASDGFYTTQSHRKLSGDAFWYVDGQGPNINGIYLLPPDKITLELGDIAEGQAVIQGYKYENTIQGQRIEKTYDPDQIVHFKVPNPKNYYRGLGVVEACADDIDMDWLAIEANKLLFKRGLIGNFVLTTDKGMTPEQRKQLRTEFNATYQGIQNAFKVPILSGGLEPKTIQLTNRDMEFIAQQEWVRDKIASMFGNNKAILGITDDVNRANAEATIMSWKQNTVRAEMKQIADTLNEFLVPRFGMNLLLGFKDPVPEDDAKDVERATGLKQAGIITRNEARDIVGYEPVEGGDEFPVPMQFNPQDLPKSLRHISVKRFMRRTTAYPEIEQYKALKKVTKPVAEKIVKSRKKPKAKENVDITRYYDKQISIVEIAEKMFQHKIERFIDRLIRKAITQVPSEVQDMQSKQLFDEENEIIQATLDFTPLLNEVATAAGNQALQLIDHPKPYVLLDFRNKIRQRVELFAGSMIKTDKDKLIDIITEGVREGRSVPDIRRNITDTFDSYSKMQAERITRTEVLKVSNQAALDAWEQSGVVEGKEWLTAPGADAECEQYNGKIVYNLGGNFFTPQNEFEDGDPPIHPNCRCVVLPIVAEKHFTQGQLREKKLSEKISELEAQIDKRTKAYKKLKEKNLEQAEYIGELEKLADEQA